MNRLNRALHALGRRRGTHCDVCGRRIPFTQSGLATTGNRLVHLHYTDCMPGGAR